MKKYLVALLCLYSLAVNADSHYGKIVGFLPYASGSREMIIFKMDNSPVSGCNVTGRFAIDGTSPHYKATVAAIIAAFHAQTDVAVAYTQSCNVWSNSWDVNYVCTGSANC